MSTVDAGASSRVAPGRDEGTSPHTPALIVAPAVDTQYRADDTLGETHAKTLQARTLARLTTYADGYDIPVLVTRAQRDDFTAPVATTADHHLECEQTRMGPRVVGEDFETQLVRAVESVLSPLGWDQTDIRRELSSGKDTTLNSFRTASNTG
jgi:hypothetical protein